MRVGRAALAGFVAACALGCVAEEPELLHAAPAQPRASLLLEPPQVPLGGVADVVLAVVTPPEWSVRPAPPPSDLLGFVWIDSEPAELVREPARWIHRTRMRIRALDVGHFSFPAGSVEVVSPEGEAGSLEYAALPFEVVSGLSDTPTRRVPFGVRLLPRTLESRGAVLGAFAAGAGLALVGVGLVFLARRRLAASPESPERPPGIPPWLWAREELARARTELERDPRAALDGAARSLRAYVVSRFGGDANVRTTPELEVAKPPFTLTTRWSGLVELLAALDAARFPEAAPDGSADGEATRLVSAVADFIDATTPPDSR